MQKKDALEARQKKNEQVWFRGSPAFIRLSLQPVASIEPPEYIIETKSKETFKVNLLDEELSPNKPDASSTTANIEATPSSPFIAATPPVKKISAEKEKEKAVLRIPSPDLKPGTLTDFSPAKKRIVEIPSPSPMTRVESSDLQPGMFTL